MSILNRPSDGLLTVLLALRRALIAYGSQKATRLLELCAPKSELISDPGMARRTLTRWTQLGMFDERDDLITLGASVKDIDADDLRSLRSALLQLVLANENNPSLAADRETDEDTAAEKSRATDFSLAASWAMAQDPYSFGNTFPQVERMLSEQRVQIKLFTNSTRWNGFVEWSHFLGIAVQANEKLILNPHFAIASILSRVFESSPELSHESFLARVAQFLPILDGGQYRKLTDAATEKPWATIQTNQVSPCLSTGLQTLVERNVLRLESRSDASQCTLLGRQGRERHPFSHVVLVKAT